MYCCVLNKRRVPSKYLTVIHLCPRCSGEWLYWGIVNSQCESVSWCVKRMYTDVCTVTMVLGDYMGKLNGLCEYSRNCKQVVCISCIKLHIHV